MCNAASKTKWPTSGLPSVEGVRKRKEGGPVALCLGLAVRGGSSWKALGQILKTGRKVGEQGRDKTGRGSRVDKGQR